MYDIEQLAFLFVAEPDSGGFLDLRWNAHLSLDDFETLVVYIMPMSAFS